MAYGEWLMAYGLWRRIDGSMCWRLDENGRTCIAGDVFRFEGLDVFQLALQLAAEVYSLSATFPRGELFGLTANVRRAATSIVLNIAEGAGRGTRREFARFVDIAIGSLFETTASMLVAQRLRYLTPADVNAFRNRAEVLSKKLSAFKRTLRP